MKRITLAVLVIACAAACGSGSGARPRSKDVIHAQGGAMIEGCGFVLDASVDPRLSDLIPGYHVINVVLVNNSFNILFLSPERDRWFVKAGGKRWHAINDLRKVDGEAWSQVPERARGLMTYPLVIPIGGRMVVDLFV
ncbi:MAG: hypothetical protein HY465_02025, partial [Deltaproteobacteria bacterium]|nr:hypothetical protein [Deltaproteobacteria bacterium]